MGAKPPAEIWSIFNAFQVTFCSFFASKGIKSFLTLKKYGFTYSRRFFSYCFVLEFKKIRDNWKIAGESQRTILNSVNHMP